MPEPTRPSDSPLVVLERVSKAYDTPAGAFHALSDVDLQIRRGDLVAIVGRSGSGKTTLIHLLTGIDRATSGSVTVGGTTLDRLDEDELATWRGRTVGVVFQFFQLLPTLTILENVVLPMELAGRGGAGAQRARTLLERVGIGDQGDKLPSALSGGQQQRAAIARALANDPLLLVADEPTGNLDGKTTDDVLGLFTELRASGTTIVVVTHDPDVAKLATRTVTLTDGRVTQPAGARTEHAAHA